MPRFTEDELARIQRTLRKQFRVGNDSNIAEIGFGMASEGGEPAPGRGFCVCFYVRRKRDPRRDEIVIPRHVNVRLKRGNQFETLSLPTDVLTVPKLRPSGALLTVRDTGFVDFATAGLVINWRLASDPAELVWGVVTVGHAFKADTGIRRSPGDKVLVRSLRHPQNGFEGTIIWIAPANSLIDAAVIRTSAKSDLVDAGLIEPTQRPSSGRVPRPLDMISADQVSSSNPTGSPGESRRNPQPFPFHVMRYHPTFALIPLLGNLQSIVSVLADQPLLTATEPHTGVVVHLDFQPGTSGSGWTIRDRASDAALQVGTNSLSFAEGFGQAIVSIMERLVIVLPRDGQDILDGTVRYVKTV